MYYMLYLDYKDRNDHNAIEKYVYDCVSDVAVLIINYYACTCITVQVVV